MADVRSGRKPFIQLTDVPPSYTTFANDMVTVLPTEDGLQFTAITSISGIDHTTLINRNAVGQHSSESAGVLSPYAIDHSDVGGNLGLVNSGWIDLGAISIIVNTISHLGNGIAIFGVGTGHIFRSTDYGNTWTDLGNITAGDIVSSSCYLGNGIALFGTGTGHIWRSIDFGINWTDLGDVTGSGSNINTISYLGNGIAIVGDINGSMQKSTDFGATFPVHAAIVGATNLITSSYLENGIFIFGDANGHIFRSTNFGSGYANLAITGSFILTTCYLSNGVVIFGTQDGHIWRSVNYGLNWTDLTAIAGANPIRISLYLGNGIAIFGADNGHIWRSADYGNTWTDLGAVVGANIIFSSAYLSNGITIIGDSIGHIWRNDVSYKLDEAEVLIDPSNVEITSNITLGQSHNMVNVVTTLGNVTVTLPSPSILQTGHEFIIKKVDSSQNIVIIDPLAITIDAFAIPRILSDFNQSLTLRSDGIRYFIPAEYQNFTVGQMKPNITRYTMPGWGITRVTNSVVLNDGEIHYSPIFVPTTTTFSELTFESTSAGHTGIADVKIFTWNDGIPGRLFVDLGSVNIQTVFGIVTIWTIVQNFTLNRGFYFIALRLRNSNGISQTYGPDFNYPVSAPVQAMTTGTTFVGGNVLNRYGMSTGVIAWNDPAPIPTAMGDMIVYLLKEN
jgi:photosystem II stability/assembly factor-like uncharacterized protein